MFKKYNNVNQIINAYESMSILMDQDWLHKELTNLIQNSRNIWSSLYADFLRQLGHKLISNIQDMEKKLTGSKQEKLLKLVRESSSANLHQLFQPSFSRINEI